MTDEGRDPVHYEIHEKIAYLLIDRPQRRNALSIATIDALVTAMDRASRDSSVRVIVVRGSGDRAFSAGLDLKELDQLSRSGQPIPTPMTGLHRNLFEAVQETYKPVIACLNGPAVGAGCELALACDLRVAASASYLSLPEARRGMGANFASVMLPRMLPPAVAAHLLYTGDQMSAAEALRWGLYNRVVPLGQLDETTESLAQRIAANAPLTLTRMKHLSVKTSGLPLSAALRLDPGPNPYLSEDREEGVRAYLEQRTPQWQGR